MDKTLVKKWTKELRSGKRKQGKQALHYVVKIKEQEEHRYCCLGVLCEVAKIPVNKIAVDFRGYKDSPADATKIYRYGQYNDAAGMLQTKHLKELGLTLDQAQSLADMNDRGVKFSTIANWIEKELL